MMLLGKFILKQSKKVLENKNVAVLHATLLSIIPFASWLSVALVVLITLRKGPRFGFEVLIPALVIHCVPLMMILPLKAVVIETLLAYIPCYIAAIGLRKTANWQVVAGVFFLGGLSASWLIQFLAPNFAMEQLLQLKEMLSSYKEYQQLIEVNMNSMNSLILAQLFFGMQILSIVVSALISLLFARSIQARLFLPGGFKEELMNFRGGKFAFLIFIGVALSAYFASTTAINVLPLALSYFFLAGFNFVYFIAARKWQLKFGIILFLLIIIRPLLVLAACVFLGLIDSIFNFRLYFSGKARESV